MRFQCFSGAINFRIALFLGGVVVFFIRFVYCVIRAQTHMYFSVIQLFFAFSYEYTWGNGNECTKAHHINFPFLFSVRSYTLTLTHTHITKWFIIWISSFGESSQFIFHRYYVIIFPRLIYKLLFWNKKNGRNVDESVSKRYFPNIQRLHTLIWITSQLFQYSLLITILCVKNTHTAFPISSCIRF